MVIYCFDKAGKTLGLTNLANGSNLPGPSEDWDRFMSAPVASRVWSATGLDMDEVLAEIEDQGFYIVELEIEQP